MTQLRHMLALKKIAGVLSLDFPLLSAEFHNVRPVAKRYYDIDSRDHARAWKSALNSMEKRRSSASNDALRLPWSMSLTALTACQLDNQSRNLCSKSASYLTVTQQGSMFVEFRMVLCIRVPPLPKELAHSARCLESYLMRHRALVFASGSHHCPGQQG